MKRHLIFLVPVLFLIFVWGCNNDSSILSTQDEALSSPESAGRFDRADAVVQGEYEFEITLENLTPETGAGSSQPFSPPVVATHTPLFHVFRIGSFASSELGQVAEDAVSGPLIEMLNQSDFVNDVAAGDGVILPGQSATIRVKAQRPFQKLSLVAMLVNTNDAFTGIDGIRLPRSGEKTYYLRAYDAGTEKNTEMKAHIPGPCCGSPLVRVPTEERIKHHRGITGTGELDPDIFGWDEPVAKLTIRMVE